MQVYSETSLTTSNGAYSPKNRIGWQPKPVGLLCHSGRGVLRLVLTWDSWPETHQVWNLKMGMESLFFMLHGQDSGLMSEAGPQSRLGVIREDLHQPVKGILEWRDPA